MPLGGMEVMVAGLTGGLRGGRVGIPDGLALDASALLPGAAIVASVSLLPARWFGPSTAAVDVLAPIDEEGPAWRLPPDADCPLAEARSGSGDRPTGLAGRGGSVGMPRGADVPAGTAVPEDGPCPDVDAPEACGEPSMARNAAAN